MKAYNFLIFGILVFLLGLSSCGFSPVDAEPANIMVVISLPSRGTIAPSVSDLLIDSYSLLLSRRGYSDLRASAGSAETTAETGFLMQNVAVGTWDITLFALNSNGDPIASGSTVIVAEAGFTKTADVILAYDQQTGTGGLEISFYYPQSLFVQSRGGMFPPLVEAFLEYGDGSIVALSAAIVPLPPLERPESEMLVPESSIGKVTVSGSNLPVGTPGLRLVFKYDDNGTTLDFTRKETVWVFRNVVTRAAIPLLAPRNPTYIEVVESGNTPYLNWSPVFFGHDLATGHNIYYKADEENSYSLLVALDSTDFVDCYIVFDAFSGYFEYDLTLDLEAMLPPGDYLFTVSTVYGYDSEIGILESDYTMGIEAPYYYPIMPPSMVTTGTYSYNMYWSKVSSTAFEADGYNIYYGPEFEANLLITLSGTDPLLWNETQYEYNIYPVIEGVLPEETSSEIYISALYLGSESDLTFVGSCYYSSGSSSGFQF